MTPHDARPARNRASVAWLLGGEIFGLVAQLALLTLGLRYIFLESDDEATESLRLLLWCIIGSFYLLCTAVWLHLSVQFSDEDHPTLSRFTGWPLVRWISQVLTFSSSAVGLTAATWLIFVRDDPDHESIYELAAVWAMLVSWALFHWGYARVYHARFYRAAPDSRPLLVPGTATPRLADFAYFSYTNGTSFAANDVTVMTTRMRWTVSWHGVFSFFFNALIIVLSMNTIAGGFGGL